MAKQFQQLQHGRSKRVNNRFGGEGRDAGDRIEIREDRVALLRQQERAFRSALDFEARLGEVVEEGDDVHGFETVPHNGTVHTVSDDGTTSITCIYSEGKLQAAICRPQRRSLRS
jgi:hypothetical protein